MKKTLRWTVLFVLFLLCALIPVTAQRAAAAAFTGDQELWIGNTQVTDSRLSGTGWSYNPSTKTLTLNNLTVSGSDVNIAIYAMDLDLTITGTATLTGTDNGIEVDGGSLTISGGNITAKGNEYYGIFTCEAGLTVSGGTVTATGAEGGIYSDRTLRISGGTVKARGTGTDGDGIYSGGDLIVSGGKVEAAAKRIGMLAFSGITVSGSATTVDAEAEDWEGIRAETVTVTGGTVTASGSFGIFADSGIAVSGGKVSADGIDDGIYAADTFHVSGGTVEAASPSNGIWAGTLVVSGTGTKIKAESVDDTGICADHFSVSGGTVTAMGGGSGIYAGVDFSVSGGTVTATGTSWSGLSVEGALQISGGTLKASGNEGIQSLGPSFLIKGGTVTAEGNTYGIVSDADVSVTKGTVTVIGKTERAYYWYGPTLSGYSNCRVLVNTAASASGAVPWDGTDPETELLGGYEGYKYVRIEPSGGPTVTTQPTDTTAAVGASVTMTTAATGTGTLSYQWQYKPKTGTSWSDAGGTSAKTANWTLTVAEVHYGFDFRCRVSHAGGTSYTNVVHIRPTLTITSQPTDKTAAVGASVTMKTAATGTGTLSYQWQYKSKSASSWSDAGGTSAKTANWTLTVAAVHYGFDFRCRVTDSYGNTRTTNTVHVCSVLSITTQPTDKTAAVGASVTMKTAASGTGLSYQWQYKNKTDTTWSNAGGTSAKTANWTLTVAAVHYGFDFRCRVTDTYGTTKYTNTVHINSSALTITTQPTDRTAAVGASVTMMTAASGTGLSYQWQYKTKSGSEWSNASGTSAKTANWTLTVAAVHYGFDFRCKVTGSGTTKYTNTVHINPALTITTQPTDRTAAVGASVTMKTAASGTGLSYQWQYKSKSGSEWSNASGTSAKTANWTLTVAAVHYGFDFRCKVTGSGTTKYTNTVHINPALTITMQPTDKTAAVGASVTMKTAASGTGLSYQWQYKSKSGSEWSNASGTSAKTADWTLTVAEVHYGLDFRCKVTGSGTTKYTNTVHINPTLTITTQPTDKTAAVGASVTMKTAASGTGLSYQWQYKTKSGSEWSNASGASAKTADWTLTVAEVHYGLDFRCKVTGSGTTKYTNTVHINPTLTITTQPTDKTAAIGASVMLKTAASGTGTLSYQWQYKSKSGSEWSNASGASAKTANWTLTVAEVHYGFDFRCRVTDSYGNVKYSGTAHVRPQLSITSQPSNKTAAVGASVTMKTTASGWGSLSYQWQYKPKSGTTWSNASGASAKTANWTLTVAEVHYGLDFRCRVTDPYGNTITTVTVRVNAP